MKSNQESEYVLDLSQEARDDIRSILQYTFETYGEAQADAYENVLNKALVSIIGSPGIGHKRLDLPSDCRAFQAGQHLVIFRVEETVIYVLRILHGSMDIGRHFD